MPLLFNVYRLMLAMWGVMTFIALLGLYYLWRKKLETTRWLLWLMVPSALFPQIANQAGWISAESGRFPWIVYNLLRISDGLSKAVTASQILGSIIMFMVVYLLLFILFIYLMHQKIRHGPEEVQLEAEAGPYHGLHHLMESGRGSDL